MESTETRYARGSDVRIAYQVIGDGPIDLLFVPGGQFPIDLIWEQPAAARFIQRLASFSRVIMFDFRGWGASGADLPEHAASEPERWADDIQLVMDTVGSKSAAIVTCTIAGLSTLYFTAANPERVQALVIIDGWSRWYEADDYPDGMPVSLADALTNDYLEVYGTGEMLRWMAPSVADDEAFKRWWARTERLANWPLQAGRFWHDYRAQDLRAVLPSIRMPTLVMHHRDNPWLRIAHGRYLADHIPGATFRELPGRDTIFFIGDIDATLDPIQEFLTGTLPQPDPDRVLATVLFTDIVGSTTSAAGLGDRQWTHLLDHHDMVVGAEVERHRGRKVQSTGDGLLATFDGPARAVRCAVAIQESLRSLGIEVRAGVHTGEIQLRGEDIGGIAVHIAQRILSMATGGEVLVSRTVTDLVTGSGLEFEDRGEHELRGVPGKWQVFATLT